MVRQATEEDAPRLRAAGERLRAAAHPGVVEVLSSTGSEREWELRLLHAGRRVDLGGPLAPEQIAAIVAATAATLADLHALGIVHGRLDASHVLIGPHGRPVLCGLGDSPPPGADATDDVAALGALLESLLGDVEEEPIPERRWRLGRATSTAARRTLLLLADHATAEPPTRRPSAGRLAQSISDAFPHAAIAPVPADTSVSVGGSSAAGEDPLDALRATIDVERRPTRRRMELVALALGTTMIAVGGLQLTNRTATTSAPTSGPTSAPTSAPTSSASSPAAAPNPSPTTTGPLGPPSPCIPPPGEGAGCAPVVVDGTSVRVGSRRYEVGQPGDRVVVGDWDCDGMATPAVLRPSTGDVFIFRFWPDEQAREVVARPVANDPLATDLVVQVGRDGCAVLAVRRPDGSGQSVGGVA